MQHFAQTAGHYDSESSGHKTRPRRGQNAFAKDSIDKGTEEGAHIRHCNCVTVLYCAERVRIRTEWLLRRGNNSAAIGAPGSINKVLLRPRLESMGGSGPYRNAKGVQKLAVTFLRKVY